jgi:hypothetical protein
LTLGKSPIPLIFAEQKSKKSLQTKREKRRCTVMGRIRNKQLKFWFTEDEIKIIKLKKEQSGIENMTDFIIASVCQSQIFAVDTSPLYAIADEISKVGTNINQIAKVANTTGHIYENEIKELQTKTEKIENVVYQHLNLFQKVRGRIKNGIRKN